MSATLHIYAKEGLSLAEALAAFAQAILPQAATAILYAPHRCSLARCEGGTLYGPEKQPLEIATVFEARVFCEQAELRWLNDPGPERRHRAVLLAEGGVGATLSDWQCEPRCDVVDALEQTYLLWGEGTGRVLGDGWSELATARIGALPVPLGDVGQNQRVLLRSREYVVEAAHGNAVVFDERLLKLEVTDG